MNKKLFLGIDTSNYTTSLCIVDADGEIVAEQRQLLPVAENATGLRQSEALFNHVKSLPSLAKRLFSSSAYSKDDLLAVGYSSRPRDKEGSYMPCFLAGEAVAVSIADALCIPCYAFSHQAGHIMSAIASSSMAYLADSDNSFISFHVSGGTTEVLLTQPNEQSFDCKIIGGTRDLNAGQAIDRVGVAMGLLFPCGKKMDELSQRSDKSFASSSLKVSFTDGYLNLSGLENMAKKQIDEDKTPEEVSKFVFSYLAKALGKCCEIARDSYGKLPVCFAGGVMSNTLIRNTLASLDDVCFAKPEYSCDNAYGTALLAMRLYRHKNGGAL